MMGQLLQALRAQDQRLREVERRVPPLPPPAPLEAKPRRA
jgi:hypothetical protein